MKKCISHYFYFIISETVMLGCAPWLTQYAKRSILICFLLLSLLFSYQPSSSKKPPSRLLLFSLTTTLNFRSPLFPVLLNRITSDIYIILSFLCNLLKSLFCCLFFGYLL